MNAMKGVSSNMKKLSICFGTWIQYVDNSSHTWQIVVGISDLKMFNVKNELVKDYKIESTGDIDNLVVKMEGKYLTTTTNSHEILINVPTQVTTAEWTYHLLAFLIDNPKQFYIVKDLDDLEKQLEYPLPVVKVKVY
jgi:hypothetical protein